MTEVKKRRAFKLYQINPDTLEVTLIATVDTEAVTEKRLMELIDRERDKMGELVAWNITK